MISSILIGTAGALWGGVKVAVTSRKVAFEESRECRLSPDVELFQDMIDRLVKVQNIEEARHIIMVESYHKSAAPQ